MAVGVLARTESGVHSPVGRRTDGHANRLRTKMMIEFANEASPSRIAVTVAAALSGAEITQNSTRITTSTPMTRRTGKCYVAIARQPAIRGSGEGVSPWKSTMSVIDDE